MGSPLDTSQFFNTPLSNVTPFTYRDGETYLERLHRLQKWIHDLSITLENNIESVEAQDQIAINTLAQQLNDALNKFANDWNAELLAIQNQNPLFIFDPTNGKRTETADVVVGRVYDNLRYYAYFADQLDDFEKTAAEWDGMQYSARGFDLALAYSPTNVQATDVATTVQPHIS